MREWRAAAPVVASLARRHSFVFVTRLSLLLASLLLALLSLAVPVAVPAADGPPAGAPKERFQLPPIDLADPASIATDPVRAAAQITGYWAGYQVQSNGDVFDPIYQRSGIRYSESEFASAAIQLAIATGDERLATFGLRAAEWVANFPAIHDKQPSSFEDAGMAALYLELPKLPRTPLRDRVAPKVRAWLARFKPQLLTDDRYKTNKSVVEALAVLDIARSDVPLPRRAFWRTRALRVLSRSFPSVAAKYTTNTRLGPATVISDPQKNPLSYDALTFGYYARAVQVLGPYASKRMRQTLVHMARGMVYLTAPDGDYAYWGRSQAVSWSHALAAYGLRIAGRFATDEERARFQDSSDDLLRKLHDDYQRGPYGLVWVPAFMDGGSPYDEPTGVDGYANAVTYLAITLKALAWQQQTDNAIAPASASRSSRRRRGPVARPAAIDGVTRLNRNTNGETVSVVTRSVWLGIRPQGMLAGNHGYDLRSDFGVVAAKVRTAAGDWVDLQRARPESEGAAADSAGPVLVLADGRLGTPTATKVRSLPDLSTRIWVRWRSGQRIVGRGVVLITPRATGYKLTVTGGPKGSHIRCSVFVREPVIDATGVRDGDVKTVPASSAISALTPDVFHSAYDRDLRRVDIDFPVGKGASLAQRYEPLPDDDEENAP